MALGSILCLAGCASTALKPSDHYAYPKPLDGWDNQVIAKYDAANRREYLKAELDKLPFIAEYDAKYPPIFRALAAAAAQYDKAVKSLNVVESELASYIKANELANARVASLKEDKADTVDYKERLQAIKDQIAANDRSLAACEGDMSLARAEVKRTETNVVTGFEGLKALSAAQYQAINDSMNESIVKEAPEYYARDKYNYQVVANMASKLKGNGIGFGLQYLESMRSDRNRILGELISVAPGFHKSLDRKLFFTRAAANIGFDSAILGATGVASVAGSETTSRVLSALGTVLMGVRESADKELFFQQTSTALLHLMQADVDAKAAVLVAGMAKGADEYTLEDGLDDYVNYLLAGDLTSAVKLLDEGAASKSREANSALQELKAAAQARPGELEKQKKAKQDAKKQKFDDALEKLKQLGITVGPKPAVPVPAS